MKEKATISKENPTNVRDIDTESRMVYNLNTCADYDQESYVGQQIPCGDKEAIGNLRGLAIQALFQDGLLASRPSAGDSVLISTPNTNRKSWECR